MYELNEFLFSLLIVVFFNSITSHFSGRVKTLNVFLWENES